MTNRRDNAESLSLAGAAALMRLGEDAVRKLIVMGELPALSLNRKHLVLLREDIIEFIRTEARRQQDLRRTAWQQLKTEVELGAVEYAPRKPGRRRQAIPELLDAPATARDALESSGRIRSRKRTKLPLIEGSRGEE